MPHFINYNEKILEKDARIATADNRGLRYGDGVFETMKFLNGEIQLSDLHFERLFKALNLLQFKLPEHFSPAYLAEQVVLLCKRNNLYKAARIRLNVFRRNGGLYESIDQTPNFVIEASELPENFYLRNEKGLVVDVYSAARKSCDAFSSLKSNNYLPYVMGALYAKESKLDDCIILNMHERICEATIANIFWIKDDIIHTPPLSEGCVAGVMRRHLLAVLPKHGYLVIEQQLTIPEMGKADEVFLTNAVSGLKWVKTFQDKEYPNTISRSIYPLLS